MAVYIRVFVIFLSFLSITNASAETTSIGPDAETLLALKTDATEYADRGAVILSRRTEITVDEQRLESTKYYRAIYIASEEAVSDYSKLVNSFNAYYHTSSIDFARVIAADGQIFNMQDDAISEVAANNDDYLDDMKRIEFAVPQLKVGNIIEYQINEKQTKAIIDGEWFTGIRFNQVKFLPQKNWVRIDPILTSLTILTIPNSVDLYIENRNTDLSPLVTKSESTTQYVWKMDKLEGIEIESGMPPIDETLPLVYVSTMNNWKTVDDWYWDLFKPSLIPADNVTALANELFSEQDTQTDKVKAVFDYMQKNVRYIGAHVNRGGYQPHTAQEVLQNAYGDCKDQTTLIVALLNEAGIKASPALVNTYNGSVVFDDLPALNFNHMITYVTTDEGSYWLDTSGQTGTFPGLSAMLGGKRTFVVTGSAGELVEVPHVQPEENVAKVAVDYSLNDSALDASVKMSFDGQVETNLRNYYQFSPEKRAVVEQLLSPFVHDNRVTSFTATDPADSATPFEIEGDFVDLLSITEDISRFHYSMNYAQILKVFTGFSIMEPVSERDQDLYIQIPITVELSITYPAPWSDAELVQNGPASNYQNPFFEITHTAQPSDNEVTSTSKFVLYAQTIPVEEYAAFFNAIDAFQKGSESMFVYDKVVATSPQSHEALSIEEQIAHSRALLDSGRFDEALEYVTELANGNKDNGEVQFLLGIVHGFNGKDALSEAAFERAESLGYQY